ncbi:HugZ family protein [Glutamicibacter sp. NPDC087344]|uniref:HugZ family pyridoxamine 5'-phosphate oxidase n=1 Tax=Glutamicibacter sp. NPDC087344 TaxID=3363994 RepID=UPI0038131A1F
MADSLSLDERSEAYLAFRNNCQTLVLSTLDDQGLPFISYAPFVIRDGEMYVYISKIAEHYWHLKAAKKVNAMMLADENTSRNLFARERARFLCDVEVIEDETDFEDVFEQLNVRFKKSLLDLLRTLDFSLFRLSPAVGRYVVGFGLAFDTDLDATDFAEVQADKRKEEISQMG